MFKNRSDYTLALMRLIERLPNRQGKAWEIRALFVKQYGNDISPKGYELLSNGEPRWDKEIQWCRYECVQNGFMDSPSTGIWRLTEKGYQWLLDNRGTFNQSKSFTNEYSHSQEFFETDTDNIRAVKEVSKGDPMLESFSDFFVPLMRILDSLPNRVGQSGDILRLFEQTYRQQIVPHQYTKNQSGNIRWEHNVRWSREKLKFLGFIDAPRKGIWRLTEKGHLWLTEHPEATHLSVEKPKSQRKNRTVPPAPAPKAVINQRISKDEFLAALQQNLPGPLQPIIGSVFYEFVQRSNYLQIRLAGFSGCHYQIILRRGKQEIGLHFESSAERSQARLRSFEPHLDALSQSLKLPVHAGNFQSRGWTQVWIEKQAQPLSLDLVNEFANLISRFVAATYPILHIIYGRNVKIHKRSVDKENLTEPSPMYRTLDQEVENIQSYLQGRSALQPSDEKLCDWVNFCYTFAMYAEGKDLFSLVSESEVHPWYYERTRRIARVCETKCIIK